MKIATVSSDGQGVSFFDSRDVALSGDSLRRLSDPIDAVNFRLRQSSSDYESSYHVAGDPTLLIILTGSVRIELRNGEYRDFSAGELFIAEDYLSPDTEFDGNTHGHKAAVLGEEAFSALHLKLERR